MYQIEGRNPVVESFHSDEKPSILYIDTGINYTNKIREIISLAEEYKVPVKKVSRKKLDKMSETKTHQGVIAQKNQQIDKNLNELLENLYEKNIDPFIIIIRDVLYEHNLGAIIRTAECAGANGVIVPPKSEISPQVIRTSMGATEHLPVIHNSFFNTLKTLTKNGIKIGAIEVNTDQYYFDEDLTGPIALIIGGEDRPITETIQKKVDFTVKIPLNGKINSLNMSVAAGIVMYEKVKQDRS